MPEETTSQKITATFTQKLSGAIGSFSWLPKWSWEHEWHRAVLPVLRAEVRFGTELDPTIQDLFGLIQSTKSVSEAVEYVQAWIEKN